MPRLKEKKIHEPLWKEWDYNADKRGLRHTVYQVNGNQYTGDWLNNLKHGKGEERYADGHLYEGDWKKGKKNGYGVLSMKDDRKNCYKRVYSGGWKNSKKHGYGTYYFIGADEYYEGEWLNDVRAGWGRMYYQDGSIYEGEWHQDKKEGKGMIRYANDNRYEGEWKNGLKHGRGKYVYIDNGQIYEGVWCNDIAKCGEMKDFDRNCAPQPTPFQIPDLKLKYPDQVLEDAEQEFLSESED